MESERTWLLTNYPTESLLSTGSHVALWLAEKTLYHRRLPL